MLHSVSSVAIYLATGSAFVVRAPRVAPADSAGSKQDSATAPLEAVGERLGTSGALTRLGGMDNKKAGHRLPRVSLAGCYRGWGGRDICPLYMVKGVQDGNTTIPIGGGGGGVERGDPGVHEGAEPPLTTREGHGDSTHGILNDADLAADGTLEPLDHQQIPCEHYSSADRDESFDKHTNDTGADEEFQFELAADSRVDDKSLTLDDAADGTTGYVPHDTNDSRSYFNEQGPFGLVASDVFNASNLGPFDNEVVKKIPNRLTDAMSDGAALKTVVLGDAMNDLVWSVLDDALTGGTASGGRMLDYDMEDMMWSKLDDAICGQASSDRTDLAAALDDVFTSLMHQAFFGSVASTAVASLTKSADVSEVVVQSYVRAVSGLYEQFKQVRIRTAAKAALNKELPAELAHDSVADPAIGSTPPDGDHTAFYEEFPFHFALGDVIDEISFGPFDLVPAEEEVDNDDTPSFLYDTDDSAFDEANPFDTIHNGIVDGIRLGSFGPVIPVYVVADKMTILHDAMSGGAISNAVDDLVRSVLESAFTTEGASTDLALDDTMDCMLWAKLHDAVCGRPISDPTSDTDSLDDMLTYLLHRALLGPAASKAVASFIMSADDIELTVLAYVRAVSEFYDKLKQLRVNANVDYQGEGRKPDIEAPVVLKHWSGGGAWFKNFWKKIRRNGQG